MVKMYDLKTTIANYERVSYFYTREKSDINGNPRFRVFILDNETPAVYETILKCYENQIPIMIACMIEDAAMEDNV